MNSKIMQEIPGDPNFAAAKPEPPSAEPILKKVGPVAKDPNQAKPGQVPPPADQTTVAEPAAQSKVEPMTPAKTLDQTAGAGASPTPPDSNSANQPEPSAIAGVDANVKPNIFAEEIAAGTQSTINLPRASERATTAQAQDLGIVAVYSAIARSHSTKAFDIKGFAGVTQMAYGPDRPWDKRGVNPPLELKYTQHDNSTGTFSLLRQTDKTKLQPHERVVSITQIKAKKDGAFFCELNFRDAAKPDLREQTLSIDTVIDQQFVLMYDVAKDSFTADQQEVMGTYYQALIGDEKAAVDYMSKPDNVKKVKEVATAASLVTDDTIKTFVGFQKAETDPNKIKDANGNEITDPKLKALLIAQAEAYNASIDASLEQILPKDHVIATPDTVAIVIEHFSKGQITYFQERIDAQIADLEKQKGEAVGYAGIGETGVNANAKQLDERIKQLQNRRKVFVDAQQMLEKQNIVRGFYQKFVTGKGGVGIGQAEQVNSLMSTSGATRQLVELFTGKNLDPDQQKSLRKFVEENGGTAGMIGLLFAWIAINEARKKSQSNPNPG